MKLGEGEEEFSKFASLLMQNGFEILLFKEEEINLEDVFLQVTKGTVA